MTLPVFIGLFLFLLFLGLPVGFVMAISSVIYFIFSGDTNFLSMLPEKLFSGLNVYVLTAIPFFMLAGDIMNESGISKRLIKFSNMVVGRFRGGLAQVNVLASIIFAGITGVALGDIAALGSVFIPSMVKEGYDKKFATAVTAASSLVGPIIPPSTITVLYAATMSTSVGAMFAGSIIPGVLIGFSDMIIVKLLADKRQYPKVEVEVTPARFFTGLKDAILAIIMPVIIIGGILTGVFTPTEAAAVSVIYALFVGIFLFKSIGRKELSATLKKSILGSAKLFLIIAGASIISWVFGIENVSAVAEHVFKSITTNFYLLVIIINLFFIFMGMWMDAGASILLFAPVIAPLAVDIGLHPVQFGIMLIVNLNIGLCTPPLGNILFAAADMAELDTATLSKELLPFLLINFIIILLVGFIPELSLYIPRLLGLI
ncbi:TRAP transporter large permease [Halocella sp. SP3-1]|uniref:TRAP transporter large permease n=1 Tax=Halocella sp. SP3-1 TaxID=2382161 RepID=UPI000F74E06C|nr:TRAP transporter large permease [Halocella sp. SP3-1]AZO94541.1 TRAP transporter large permease [Halocella sp. SP3-1]